MTTTTAPARSYAMMTEAERKVYIRRLHSAVACMTFLGWTQVCTILGDGPDDGIHYRAADGRRFILNASTMDSLPEY